jgi:hypothetical protein
MAVDVVLTADDGVTALTADDTTTALTADEQAPQPPAGSNVILMGQACMITADPDVVSRRQGVLWNE